MVRKRKTTIIKRPGLRPARRTFASLPRSRSQGGGGQDGTPSIDFPAPTPSGYEGPLDIVAGAITALSQRAMSSALRGSALYTIRESGGSTEQSFDSDATTGEAPAAAITAFIDGNVGHCILWNDQSGNSLDMVPPSTGPTWEADLINGPAFSADSSKFFNRASFSDPGGAHTIFAVVDFDTVNGPLVVGWGSDSADCFTLANYFNNEGEVYVSVGGSAYWVSTDSLPLGVNTVILEAVVAVDGTVSIFANGADLHATLQVGSLTPMPALSSGSLTVSGGNALNIAEIVPWASVLSAPDRLAIRQNMAAFYGITL